MIKIVATAILASSLACVECAPLPIAFEENRGQAAPEISFLSHASGYRLFLTRDGALIVPKDGTPIRVRLGRANRTSPAGVELLRAKSNYLTGSDPLQWHTGVLNYGKVRYARIYPGIDLVWHGQEGSLEHDFVVAAGADPRRIGLDIQGAPLRLDTSGDLIAASIRFRKPRAFQDGKEIACRYEFHGRRIGFALARYDHFRPVTIDPVLSYSSFLGGSGMDSANSVALDGAGNIYVAGNTTSTDFPVTAGAVQTTVPGGECVGAGDLVPCVNFFVSKFTNNGENLLFSTYLGGGSAVNTLTGMAVDKAGNVFMTGTTHSLLPKLTPLPGNAGQTFGPYVLKLSADGSSVIYATLLPSLSPGSSQGGLAVDAQGAVYLTGSTQSGLPVLNAFQTTVTKPLVFKTTDSAEKWQGLTNGITPDLVSSIAIDPDNPQTVYLGLDHALYKSTDAGGTWVTILQGAPPGAPYPGLDLYPTCLVVDPTNSQTLYLGTLSNGIFKSTDGGKTWSPSGSGASRSVRMLAIDRADPATLYSANDDGLYTSTDGAETWKPTGLIAPAGVMYFVWSVVIDPSNPATLYAGTDNGVMKSLDSGKTWAAASNGLPNNSSIESLIIDPDNPKVLYTSNGTPYYTTDGGAHWTQGQWPSSDYPDSLLIDPLVHTTVWAATDSGLLVSRDSGVTWTAAPSNLSHYGLQRLGGASDGTIYAIANNFTYSVFVTKLDPTGSRIVYSTYLGGSGTDLGQSIAVDSVGRAYITGRTSSFDFPLLQPIQQHPGGYWDAFVSVLDPTGSHMVWSTYLGGNNDDEPQAIAIDPVGDVHLTGWTLSTNFPLLNPTQSRFAGGVTTDNILYKAFVTKLKGDGSGLIFSTYLGGSGGDLVYGVAADPAGNTYVAGVTGSTDFPTLNAIQPTLNGTANAFIASWNGTTGALRYSTYLGGSKVDGASAIAADANGTAYITGSVMPPDFPVKYPFQSVYGGNEDTFLAEIAAAGPAIALYGVTNAASYGTTISPGEIFSIFGSAMALAPAVAGTPPLPEKLSDVTVTVNNLPAPLFYVSPLQINAQIPFETPTGPAQIKVTSSAGTATSNVTIAPAAPAIFTLNSSGSGPGAIEHALTGELVTKNNPASTGEIISIYCTGLGAVAPLVMTGAAGPIPPAQTALPVTVTIAGASAHVSFSGLAPGFAGLYQVNAEIPAGVSAGEENLQITVDGVAGNTVTLAIN